MTDEDEPAEDEEQSFRERVEEIRQEQADREEQPGGGPGMGEMMGGMGGGGNPFAQMMGGMMGGGGGGGGGAELDTERVVRELGRVREELRDVNENLSRIADALEDD